jgi:rubredoxin
LKGEENMWALIIIGLIFLFIFWPIGVALIIIGLIIWASRSSKKEKGIPRIGREKKCPKCAEIVKAEAVICRFCGYEFPSETKDKEIQAETATREEFLRKCPKCGGETRSSAPECRFCFYKFPSPQPN